MKIYLIRHGESEDDLNNCNGGVADWDISKGGVKQATVARPIFETFGIEKFYTSPLRRAYKTAEILNVNTRVPLEKVFDLHETNRYGYLSGVEKSLAEELFAYLFKDPKEKEASYYDRVCMPGGETPDDLDKRVTSVFKTIVSKSKNLNTIAIVAHGGVIKSFFWSVLKYERKIRKIGDVAFAEIEFLDGKYKLLKTEGYDII
ncbi:MAG: histidine phosphatase family protein [Firmicutes bacterium]|nr:histidine phosphatase family protein [Bacillota bacterium]